MATNGCRSPTEPKVERTIRAIRSSLALSPVEKADGLLRSTQAEDILLPLAVLVLRDAREDAAVDDGRRGVALVTELAFAELLVTVGRRAENERLTRLVAGVDAIVDENRRRIVGPADSLLPDLFARVGLPADRDA